MPNNRDNRHKLIALASTAIISALTVVLLFVVTITYNHAAQMAAQKWPPVDSAELLFGGEYVIAGDPEALGQDEPAPAASVEPQPAASQEVSTANEQENTPEPLVTQEKPSVAKAKPTQATEAHTAQAAEAEQQRDQTKRDIASRTNKFNGNGTGRQGSPDGNSDQGAISGTPGASLGNRRYLGGGDCSSKVTGKIVVSIQVNREGKVTSANITGGTPPASSNAAQRALVLKKAHQARFSPSSEAPVSQKGTLTYIFK